MMEGEGAGVQPSPCVIRMSKKQSLRAGLVASRLLLDRLGKEERLKSWGRRARTSCPLLRLEHVLVLRVADDEGFCRSSAHDELKALASRRRGQVRDRSV